MTDKPFDPVTEGTPEEHVEAITKNIGTTEQWLAAIAARDAAMLERGRLKGLEEGAQSASWQMGYLEAKVCEALEGRYPGIKEQFEAEMTKCQIDAIRTAAETAKEGE